MVFFFCLRNDSISYYFSVHLQDLENQLRSKKYKLNNDETVQNRNPLFVLDMPCYCDDENSQNNINNGSRTITKKVQDESEDITSSIGKKHMP